MLPLTLGLKDEIERMTANILLYSDINLIGFRQLASNQVGLQS